MRKVTFGVANSLDNFIAREDDGVDWLLWSDEVASLSAEFWKTIDTVVMGRKTYEVALRGGTTAYPGVRNIVFSRILTTDPNKTVEFVAEDAAAFVRDLKQQDGKGICVMGGGELAHSLFEAGMIDELVVNIHPVLLGSGLPLFFPMSQQINLELLDCKLLPHGCVLLTYRVKAP
jgi:dihydrofolate reductase